MAPAQKPGKSKQDLYINNIGVFGRLSVTGFHHKDVHSVNHYSCICSCGKLTVVSGQSLKKGKTRSCGCLRDEVARQPKLHRRLPNKGGAKNQVFLSIRRQAKWRKIPFDLTKEFVLSLIAGYCSYCGSGPKNTFVAKNKDELKYNGIDRINSSLGYTVGNVVTCCAICNRAKSDLSYPEFMSWIEQISRYNT